MIIELGKYYKTRGGRVIGPMATNDRPDAPTFAARFPWKYDDDVWSVDGRYSLADDEPKSHDIVEEVTLVAIGRLSDNLTITNTPRPGDAPGSRDRLGVNGAMIVESFRRNAEQLRTEDMDDQSARRTEELARAEVAAVKARMIDQIVDKALGPIPPKTTKASLLEAAKAAVADRGLNYGKPEDNFARIAELWNGHLRNIGMLRPGAEPLMPILKPEDVAMLMCLMKIARLENDPSHLDSWTDLAGYAACGAEISA